MKLLKKRTRMINFRVYEDEWEKLKQLCIERGFASISDLARTSVYQLIEEPALMSELQNLKARVIDLEQQLGFFVRVC